MQVGGVFHAHHGQKLPVERPLRRHGSGGPVIAGHPPCAQRGVVRRDGVRHAQALIAGRGDDAQIPLGIDKQTQPLLLRPLPQSGGALRSHLDDGGVPRGEEFLDAGGGHGIHDEQPEVRLPGTARVRQPLQPVPSRAHPEGADGDRLRAMERHQLQDHRADECPRLRARHPNEREGLQLDDHRHVRQRFHRLQRVAEAHRAHRIQVLTRAGVGHGNRRAQPRPAEPHARFQGIRIPSGALPHPRRADDSRQFIRPGVPVRFVGALFGPVVLGLFPECLEVSQVGPPGLIRVVRAALRAEHHEHAHEHHDGKQQHHRADLPPVLRPAEQDEGDQPHHRGNHHHRHQDAHQWNRLWARRLRHGLRRDVALWQRRCRLARRHGDRLDSTVGI